MAHQRVYDFPSPDPSVPAKSVNALAVGGITLNQNGPGQFNVSLFVQSTIFATSNFATEQEARDFYTLWVARVENAG